MTFAATCHQLTIRRTERTRQARSLAHTAKLPEGLSFPVATAGGIGSQPFYAIGWPWPRPYPLSRGDAFHPST